MAECKHEWLGKEDGVHCLLCGKHLDHEAYLEYLGISFDAQVPQKTRKKKSTGESK